MKEDTGIHKVVTVSVTVNGGTPTVERVRLSGHYDPNIVKRTVEDQYHRDYPNSKIAIVIMTIGELSSEEYMKNPEQYIHLTINSKNSN